MMMLFVVTSQQALGGIMGKEVKVFTTKSGAEAHARQRRDHAEAQGWPTMTSTIEEAELGEGHDTELLRGAFATIHREIPGCYHALENVLRLAPLAAHVEFGRLMRHVERLAHQSPSTSDIMRAMARGLAR